MTKPWFKAQPHLLEDVALALQPPYVDLRLVEEDNKVYVRGSLPIVHEGQVLDRYQIEIEFPNNYPKALPKVRETAGRIPRFIERHVIPSTGSACLLVDEEWLLQTGGYPHFRGFLDGPVRNFFIGQSLVETGKPWPFGQRSHGSRGLLEAYGEWFDTQDEAMIVRYLDCLSRERIKGHLECPCGSGEKLRKCHLETVRRYQRKIPWWIAREALQRLIFMKRREGANGLRP